MRFIVTGSHGFLGRELINQLSQNGHEHEIIAHKTLLNYEFQNPGDPINKLIHSFRPQVFLHAGWNVNPVNWRDTPSQELWIFRTKELLGNLSVNGIQSVVGVGSCLEYSESNTILTEDSYLTNSSQYIRDKVKLHEVIFESSRKFGFKAAWARLFYLYGPGDNKARFLPMLLDSKRHGFVFQIKNPNKPLNYIHIEDAANALIRISLRNSEEVEIYNVTSKCLTTPNALRSAIFDMRLENVEYELDASQKLSHSSLWGDNSKILKLGWSAKRSLREYLAFELEM